MPHPCTHELMPWIPVTGHFGGRSLIGILRRAGVGGLAGGLQDIRMEKSVDWLSERENTVCPRCVHAGPRFPCKWKTEHRDTLYFSFTFETVMLHFHTFPSRVDVVIGTHCIKAWTCAVADDPRCLVLSPLGGLLDLRRSCTLGLNSAGVISGDSPERSTEAESQPAA